MFEKHNVIIKVFKKKQEKTYFFLQVLIKYVKMKQDY